MTILKDYLKGFLPQQEGEKIPDIPDLLNIVINNSRDILPKGAFTLFDELTKNKDKNLQDLKCQLSTETDKGQKEQCAKGNRESDYRNDLQFNRLQNSPAELKQLPRSISNKYPSRGLTTKLDNRNRTTVNQNLSLRASNYRDVVTKFEVPKSTFPDAYDPLNPNATLGNKALLFDANGRVLKTANEIGREGRLNDLSASLASSTPVRTQAPRKNNPKRELKNLGDAINKVKGTGEINSLASLFAAITGVVVIIAVLAVLVPMSFLTVALNWLQTITTMFTNIKDVTSTYLSFVDAGFALFGYPKATKQLKDVTKSIAYGLFGKGFSDAAGKNINSAKAAFAEGILNLTSMTKLLEKIEAGRNGTNSKIDGVAFSLGTANNALKEGGLIPPDSPWSSYSENVDKFVENQAKVSTDTELKENIEKLTDEILTGKEVAKELADEKEARDTLRAQRQKEVDNLQNLGENIKPIIEKQINEAKE